jgi:hypothetical protein
MKKCVAGQTLERYGYQTPVLKILHKMDNRMKVSPLMLRAPQIADSQLSTKLITARSVEI